MTACFSTTWTRYAMPIEGNRLSSQHHLAALCTMWESVCAEKGWVAGHQVEYTNAINKLSDTLAWSSHLRQQAQTMCRMWERVCYTQGWRPDALPAYVNAMAFLHSAQPFVIQ